jgi:transcriptional regulator with XRE-family HTH domain
MEGITMHQRIKAARKALKLTQVDFARQIGLAQTALSMMELGHNTITDKNIKLICVTFNVNEQWLRTGKGQMFNDSPYVKELCDIFVNLTPETQRYLLLMARELLGVQQKLLEKTDTDSLSSRKHSGAGSVNTPRTETS